MSDTMMARTASGTGTSQTIDTLHVRTDSTGTASFRYVASQFGGVERIRARLLSDTTKWDTLSVKTRVPGLYSITSGTNNIITYTSPQAAQYHRRQNSNYGTTATLNAIDSAVHQYAQEYGMPSDIYLAVIDMSLPFGGGFDLFGQWETDLVPGRGHQYHRLGKSVDFSYFYRNANGQAITVYIYIDGELRETTNRIDDVELDARLNRLGFDRWERRIRKIHYESRK